MPETENAESADAPETQKAKGPKSADATPRSLSTRIERSLKDVDRLMKKSPEAPAQQKAMVQLEQAKVSALLELADAIRENKKG
jgi:hypothetical protein